MILLFYLFVLNLRRNVRIKIAVAGTGYVGLSIATLLAQYKKVAAVDIVPEKLELINKKSLLFRMNISKNIWRVIKVFEGLPNIVRGCPILTHEEPSKSQPLKNFDDPKSLYVSSFVIVFARFKSVLTCA